jgi:hypothetical protein
MLHVANELHKLTGSIPRTEQSCTRCLLLSSFHLMTLTPLDSSHTTCLKRADPPGQNWLAVAPTAKSAVPRRRPLAPASAGQTLRRHWQLLWSQ